MKATPHHKRVSAAIGLKIGVLLALLGGLGFGWQQLVVMRQEVSLKQEQLEQTPLRAAQTQAAATSLKKREAELKRLAAFFIRREDMNQVITLLEAEAKKQQAEVVVSDIQEAVVLGDNGEPVPVPGRYRDVHLSIQAVGDPENLLAFLHQVEHLPPVMRLAGWRIGTTGVVLPSGFTSTARPQPNEAASSAKPATGILEGVIIVTIHADE